jgi:hypothetical protein
MSNGSLIPDVYIQMSILGVLPDQAFIIPGCIAILAEKCFPHIIVDTDDFMTLFTKKPHGFGTDQACRSCNQYL